MSTERIAHLGRRVAHLRATLDAAVEAKRVAEAAAQEAEQAVEHIAKAKTVVQEAAKRTQQQLQVHLSTLVSSALAAVFPDPYEFVVDFVSRRGRVECDLSFSRGGMSGMNPMDSSGGGPQDVASLALRMAFWALSGARPVLVLDEPFKWVSVDLHAACASMLRELAAQLGVQIIMISHLPGIAQAADRVFEVHAGVVSVKESAA